MAELLRELFRCVLWTVALAAGVMAWIFFAAWACSGGACGG